MTTSLTQHPIGKAAGSTAVVLLLMPLIMGLNMTMRHDVPTPATATASAGVSAGRA